MGKKYVGEFLWHNEEDITCDYFIESVVQKTVFGRTFRVKEAYCVELPKKRNKRSEVQCLTRFRK